ncbi:hypothetical protein LAZ67_13001157 [Cordylochernes scorpioides]|uniref:Transposase n=1 Tax=Cordylochernes scorpioides TaxID=51811 RepID=A0ABY6L413_9ARAC|nr:hypothetical protein LAZ67_13001157 [Cordylochernes scorpioides]
MPRRNIRAHYDHMSELERGRAIGLKETGDETWIYNFDPETKRQSTLWCSSKSPSPKKVRRARSLEDRKTINSDWYTTKCLPAVSEKIKPSRSRAQLKVILLHQCNTRPRTSAQTLDFLSNSGVQLVTHPPYSSDLAPCDFLFPKVELLLKKG